MTPRQKQKQMRQQRPQSRPPQHKIQKKKTRRILPGFVSSPWFPVIVTMVLVEFAVLIYLATKLEAMSRFDGHSKWMNPASLRRKMMRWFSSDWRQKSHSHNDNSNKLRGERKSPAFHHSQLLDWRAGNRMFLSSPKQNYNNQHTNSVKHRDSNNQTLDNFYTRSHIPSSQKVPFLIVGGSDGSGTRTFVQTLMELGVTMIFDDASTMDVHGEEMMLVDDDGKRHYGWPPLVQLVLNATHSANYTVHDLPRDVHEKAVAALLHFKSSLLQKGKDARKLQPPNYQVHQNAAGVQYGWKAPVSMVLLPLLQQVFGPIKFIHVVRDGRDVAISENQSPLQKFYSVYYNSDTRDEMTNDQEKSMRLWNDWNQQVYQWETYQQQSYEREKQELAKEGEENDDGTGNIGNLQQHLDYLVMRTEDLIRPETRFEALVQLAEFVGGRITPEQLCCLSHQYLHDLGTSGMRDGGPRDQVLAERVEKRGTVLDEQLVMSRYGKWKNVLKSAPDVRARLQDIGANSLNAFGYEPSFSTSSMRFLDEATIVKDYSCKEKITENKLSCSQVG